MWVPLDKKKKKTKAKTKQKESEGTVEAWEKISQREKKKFLFILSQIYGNPTVGIRRDKHEKCSTRRGLRVSTRNTGFHQEFK